MDEFNKLKDKTVLVTGGAGFIGSNLVKEFLERGYNVRVIDNFSTGSLEKVKPFLDKVEFIEGDLTDFGIAKKAANGADFILHQAAIPSVARSIKAPLLSHDSNITATLNILLAAKENNVKKFVYASSSSIYGNSPTLPKKEDMAPNPLSFYGLAKYTSEKYCELFYRLYGLPIISLRYFNVFGENQDHDSEYSAVIPKFIKAIMAGERPIVFGDGEQTRDFTYVDNVVKANILALESDVKGENINIACGERISLNQLISIINEILNKNIEPFYREERKGDIKHSLADISKAKNLLGYESAVNFREGLEKLVKFYKQNEK